MGTQPARSPGEPDALDLALRAWAVPDVTFGGDPDRTTSAAQPDRWLVYDTETRLDPEQALTVGVARLYRPRQPLATDDPVGRECFGEYWFYGEALDPDEISTLEGLAAAKPTREYHGSFWNRDAKRFEPGRRRVHLSADGVPLVVVPRARFVDEVFVPMAKEARALIVGFNLPFDLSRLAMGRGETRRPMRRRDASGRLPERRRPWDSFAGGFSLKLAAGKGEEWLPRIAVKTIDSKRHLIALRGTEEGEATKDPHDERFRGHFLDLRTLAFSLTNTSYSLDRACRAFETAHQKLDHEPTGRVTPEEVTYARGDVLATYDLAEALLAEYERHPVAPTHPQATRAARPLQPTKAYSPASIGKAYLRAMGVTPPLSRGWDMPPERLAQAMSAFYGGRAECRLRRVPVPVAYVDFTSMYPTVNGLLGLWNVLTATDLRIEDATDSVRGLLDRVTLDGTFDPALWPELRGFAQVVPEGDVLPTRAHYEGGATGWQIGVNPLTSARPLWYALPDLAASTLLTGRPPRILDAFRLVPGGRLGGLGPVALRGEVPVDPAADDFFAAVIERRAALPKGADRRLSSFLKVLANATSYGIFAETVRHELPGSETIDVAVYGLAGKRVRPIPTPEEPGAYAFPPIAALITAAARLMLALLERCVTDAGGAYVMVDTDSMAIVANEGGAVIPCPGGPVGDAIGADAVQALSWEQVEAIRRRFDRLNPYAPGSITDILKLEDHNFAAAPTAYDPDAVDRSQRIELQAFAVSAKRYALFERTADSVVIRKPSEHGLGHLLNPDDPEDKGGRRWIRGLWAAIVDGDDPAQALSFAGRPAVTRTTVSHPRLLRPFERGDSSGPYRLRPFNFLLSANIAPGGHPPSVEEPAHFHLVARYERDPARWLRMRWLDRYSWRAYGVTTGPTTGDVVRLSAFADIATAYAYHPEPKSTGADGRPASRQTVGLLQRRPVRARSITYIGKEANELDAIEEGQFHALDEVVNDYGGDEDRWETLVRPTLALIPTDALAERSGLSRRTVQRAVAGRAHPHAGNAERLEAALATLVAERLAAAGDPVPPSRDDRYRALLGHSRDPTTRGADDHSD